jgi:hypothetical protein
MTRLVFLGAAAAVIAAVAGVLGLTMAASQSRSAVRPPSPPAGCESARDSAAAIAQDMALPGEEHPEGVPHNNGWGDKPRLGLGNAPGGFSAIQSWGQLYLAENAPSPQGAAVELKDLHVWLLDRVDHRWRLIQSSADVDGAAYREDFAGDQHVAARTYRAADGGTVATMTPGMNYHFWTTDGRKAIDPSRVGGLVVTLKARLVPDPAADPPDPRWTRADLVLSVGADYWLNTTAKWDNLKTNNDAAIGRFKRVRPCWRSFTMTTLSGPELDANPPPLD